MAPLPCTLLVVDEIQQFIGERIPRANDVQEIAEHCCTDLASRLLIVGTGQSALNTTPSLQRLQARFYVRVQLSDTDVESVIRKTVLQKKPEHEAAIKQCMEANQGELARHLHDTRFAATNEDEKFFVADYPLLPTRRRFWEKVLRNTDHSGTKAQLRSQLQIVFEATRKTADASVGTVVPADFIYDQISTDLLNSGELEKEYDEIIRKQRDGTKDGDLRSSLCALIFLIGKLPRTPGADDGVRANAEALIDLLVSDLKSDRPRLEQQVPKLLKQLVDQGQLMAVESEYRLADPRRSGLDARLQSPSRRGARGRCANQCQAGRAAPRRCQTGAQTCLPAAGHVPAAAKATSWSFHPAVPQRTVTTSPCGCATGGTMTRSRFSMTPVRPESTARYYLATCPGCTTRNCGRR